MDNDKSFRGNASQFFVAAELCRRGYAAVVTLGNTPNTDILCSDRAGTRFVHIQVKTFVPGNKTCSVGAKAERKYGNGFFWVIAGIPAADSKAEFEYYVIPAAEMAANVSLQHREWLRAPGRHGQQHRESKMRTVSVGPRQVPFCFDITPYRDRWDLITSVLDGASSSRMQRTSARVGV